jgi:hypothetical protein
LIGNADFLEIQKPSLLRRISKHHINGISKIKINKQIVDPFDNIGNGENPNPAIFCTCGFLSIFFYFLNMP